MISARQAVVRVVFASGLLLLASFGIYRLGCSIFGAKEYSFTFAPFISLDLQKKIIATITRSPTLGATKLKSSLDALYCDIDTVHVERFATHMADISIDIFPPVAQLTGDQVLTTSGAVIAKTHFNPRVVAHLPQVTVSDVKSLSVAGKAWLVRWLPSLVPHYRVVWVADHEIYLHDKKHEGIVLVCTIETVFDSPVEQRIAALYQKITQKKEIGSQSLGWTADIRFKKQIILCEKKGGGKHG